MPNKTTGVLLERFRMDLSLSSFNTLIHTRIDVVIGLHFDFRLPEFKLQVCFLKNQKIALRWFHDYLYLDQLKFGNSNLESS